MRKTRNVCRSTCTCGRAVRGSRPPRSGPRSAAPSRTRAADSCKCYKMQRSAGVPVIVEDRYMAIINKQMSSYGRHFRLVPEPRKAVNMISS